MAGGIEDDYLMRVAVHHEDAAIRVRGEHVAVGHLGLAPFRQALAGRRRVLGEGRPSTQDALCLYNLLLLT